MNRAALMRHLRVYACPDWCLQQDDEGDLQAHVSDWVTFIAYAGDVVRVRAVVGWAGANDDRHVEWHIIPSEVAALAIDPGSRRRFASHSPQVIDEATALDGTRILLDRNDLRFLERLIADGEVLIADWVDHGDNPVCGWNWAYQGAEFDSQRPARRVG